jgi:MinD-like ATPase involved in chromosome partitioning or flagellar assembly
VLITIVSGKAAPGVTTATWALSMAWPRAVLTIDADPAGGDMAAGLLLGRVQVDLGVLSWSAAARRAPAAEAATMIAAHVVTLPEATQLWVMPGFQNASQSTAMDAGGWDRLARALERETAATGRDVLVDTGRLSDSSCWPVIRCADQVVLVCRRSGRSIHAAHNATGLFKSRLGDLGSVSLLVVDDGPYAVRSIAQELGMPLLGELPADRATAAVLSDGSAGGVRGLERSKLLRAARPISVRLAQSARARSTQVGAGR